MSRVDPWIGPRGAAAQRLLRIIREHGPLTRPDLARLTGMSPGGIRPLVGTLLAEGQLTEHDPPSEGVRGRGRPGTLLTAVVPAGVVLGLDFGHAHVSVAAADLRGTQLGTKRAAVDVDRHAHDALDTAAALARDVLAHAQEGGRVVGVTAGVPGPVDRNGQVRSRTIVSSWWQLPIADEIARRLELDPELVDVEHDARLGALGEHRRGAALDCDDFVYVKASHGLGAGLVLAGELYRGAGGLTGEIGHAVVEADGALCRCGNRGCLETLVSVDRVREQIRFVSGADVADLAVAAIDPAARRIVLDAGRRLGRALADVCTLLDPGRVVLGGELAAAGAPLVEGVAESIRRYAQPAAEEVSVVLSALGEDAQVVGALVLAGERARRRLWS